MSKPNPSRASRQPALSRRTAFAGVGVVGVGDQERIGVREACPDAIQQVFGRAGREHVCEVGWVC